MSFGYKTAWFAVRSSNTEAVVRALGLRAAVPSKAQVAIDAAYGLDRGRLSGKAFVAAPLEGWSLVMSTGFLDIPGAEVPEMVAKLSLPLVPMPRPVATGSAKIFDTPTRRMSRMSPKGGV